MFAMRLKNNAVLFLVYNVIRLHNGEPLNERFKSIISAIRISSLIEYRRDFRYTHKVKPRYYFLLGFTLKTFTSAFSRETVRRITYLDDTISNLTAEPNPRLK